MGPGTDKPPAAWRREDRRGMLLPAKWACAALSAVLLAMFGLSLLMGVAIEVPERVIVAVSSGALVVGRWSPGLPNTPPPPPWDLRFSSVRNPPAPTWWYARRARGPWSCADIPLWWGILPVGFATVYLWRTCPAAVPRGSCPSCAYDRKGLAESAPCPECGAPIPSK